MIDQHLFLIFLAAALVLAICPGPGVMYVLARTLSGGHREGISSCLGTFVGGLAHVLAAALGISAILATSAAAFTLLKYAGAIYLIWIGIRIIQTRHASLDDTRFSASSLHVFRQGVLTELLNPKTALFFLSFLPQFVSPATGHVELQLLLLGVVSVALNTTVDLIVVMLATPLGRRLATNVQFRRNQRVTSGAAMIGLGAFAVLGERS
jgi:threonine/homoserine/homoserine lactone efflux protein